MKRCQLVSLLKLTTFLAAYEHVLITCCFSGFSWERILFLKSACVNMVMQIQVQTGDTKRVFLWIRLGVLRIKKNYIFVRFRRHVLWILVYFTNIWLVRMADIRLASLVYFLVYVSTYCVPVALLRQNKPFRLQIINQFHNHDAEVYAP